MKKRRRPDFDSLFDDSESDNEIVETEDAFTQVLNAQEEVIENEPQANAYICMEEELVVAHPRPNFKKNLIDWSMCNNLTMTAVTQLLHLLKDTPAIDFNDLPRDCRTLYKTPRNIKAPKMDDGFFYYFGLSVGFQIRKTLIIF